MLLTAAISVAKFVFRGYGAPHRTDFFCCGLLYDPPADRLTVHDRVSRARSGTTRTALGTREERIAKDRSLRCKRRGIPRPLEGLARARRRLIPHCVRRSGNLATRHGSSDAIRICGRDFFEMRYILTPALHTALPVRHFIGTGNKGEGCQNGCGDECCLHGIPMYVLQIYEIVGRRHRIP